METNHDVRPRRGRPRDPDAEPRIREYALKLLLERGFDGMTVDDAKRLVDLEDAHLLLIARPTAGPSSSSVES